jgi:hypothetical protein
MRGVLVLGYGAEDEILELVDRFCAAGYGLLQGKEWNTCVNRGLGRRNPFAYTSLAVVKQGGPSVKEPRIAWTLSGTPISSGCVSTHLMAPVSPTLGGGRQRKDKSYSIPICLALHFPSKKKCK